MYFKFLFKKQTVWHNTSEYTNYFGFNVAVTIVYKYCFPVNI